MIKIVSNSEMREMDSKAINQYGVPGIVLMENAGRNTAEIILNKCDELEIDTVLIFAGKGNNGGDGFVIARYLANYGIETTIYILAVETEISGDAKTNFEICSKSNINIVPLSDIQTISMPLKPFLIVDALLGTGVNGAVHGFYAEVIKWINQQPSFVCAVDIPSGLSGDNADIKGPVVLADLTCTMGLPKLSMFFQPARSCCGDIRQIDIGFPAELQESDSIKINVVDQDDIFFSDPDPSLHKHKAGRVFVLGGSSGMTGAVVLSSKAASIARAGLVVAGVAKSLNSILETKLTEQLSIALPEAEPGIVGSDAVDPINEKIDWCDALLVGPGAGRHKQTLSILHDAIEYALKLDKKIVIDADALFLIARDKKLLSTLNENCVITPHHGEFLRIDELAKEKINGQPWQALNDFIDKYPVVTNLKGAPSIVGQYKQGLFINSTGNPGLAKGGSGDILAGMIAGLCASGYDTLDAAVYANYIHGFAADKAAEKWALQSFSMENLLDEIKLVFKEFY